MISETQAIARLDSLVIRLNTLLSLPTQINVTNESLFGECQALLYAGKNACLKIFEDSQTTYALAINALDLDEAEYGNSSRSNRITITTLLEILRNVKEEIKGGFFSTVVSQIQAGVFDDFIEHADAFLKAGRKNEAGAIAGVTFEDTIRKLCTKQGIPEKSRKLDELISELTRSKIINDLEAKRARVAAHVRTKATHAQWDEFDADAVSEVIGFLRNSLLLRLAS